MNFVIVARGRSRIERRIDLAQPRTLLLVGAAALLLITAIFASGLQLGRFLAGPLQSR